MTDRLRVLPFLLLLVSGLPARATAQLSPARDPSGDWAGSAVLTSPCRAPNPCRLVGGMASPSIRFENLSLVGAQVDGFVSIHVPSLPGCPGIDITHMPVTGTVSSTRITLEGAGLHFDLRQTTNLLEGMVVSSGAPGSPDVCGEVKLSNTEIALETKDPATGAPDSTAKGAASAKKGGGGRGAGPLLLLGGLAAAGAAIAIGASMATESEKACAAKCNAGYRFCSNFGVEVCCPVDAPALCPDGRSCTTITFASCPGGGSAIVCCPGTTDCKSGC